MSKHAAGLFSWLRNWSPEDLTGTLRGIYVAPEAGAPMHGLSHVEAIAGQGLAGDRYASGGGHWKATDGCQVTLVALDDMAAAERRSGLAFSLGEHRRNLVVSGIPLAAFRNNHVRIGEALFRFHRLRPPCGYLERLVGAGAVKALSQRGGIGLAVVEDGTIRVGDEVRIIISSRQTRR